MDGIKNQMKDDQERINNSVLVVGLYNQDSCISVVNFFTINLPSRLRGCESLGSDTIL